MLKRSPEANILSVYLDLFAQISMNEKSLDIDPFIHGYLEDFLSGLNLL